MFPKPIVTVFVLAFVVYAECRPSNEYTDISKLPNGVTEEEIIRLICKQLNDPWTTDNWVWEQILNEMKAECEKLYPVSTTTAPATTVPSTVPSTTYPTTSWTTAEPQLSETTPQPTPSAGDQEQHP